MTIFDPNEDIHHRAGGCFVYIGRLEDACDHRLPLGDWADEEKRRPDGHVIRSVLGGDIFIVTDWDLKTNYSRSDHWSYHRAS